MRSKLIISYDSEVAKIFGSRSVAAALYSEITYRANENQKKTGEVSVITSVSWLAEKIECTERAIYKAIAALKSAGLISSVRSKKFTRKSGEHVCDLKICPIAESESTLNPVQSTLNPVQSTLNAVQSTLNPVQSTLNAVQSTLNPVQSTLNPVQSTLNAVQSTLNPVQSTLNAVQSTLNPVQSTLNPVQSTLNATPLNTASSKGFKNEKTVISKNQYLLEKEIYKEKIAIETGVEKKSEHSPDKTKILDEQFDEWWEVYPKRLGSTPKIPAKRAFIAALSKKKSTTGQFRPTPTAEELIAKTKAFATRIKNLIDNEKNPKQLEFLRQSIPMAATWLNQDRWLDETEPLVESGAQSNAPRPITPIYDHPEELKKQLITAFGENTYVGYLSQCKIVNNGRDIEISAPNGWVKSQIENVPTDISVIHRFFNKITVLVMEAVCISG